MNISEIRDSTIRYRDSNCRYRDIATRMSSFHKPKMFRSGEGCCICRAKSSSSRFTDSSRYEEDFQKCFRLQEERFGEICNACVLLVKRWRKLPKHKMRDWAHVVDARAGPGAKNFVKKKIEKPEVFHKIRRKTKTKKRSSEEPSLTLRSPTPLSDESFCSDVGMNMNSSRKRIEDNVVTDFFCPFYWTREIICCGAIFRGLVGEVMIDPRHYRKCSRLVHGKIRADNSVARIIESELKKLSENESITNQLNGKHKSDQENDEGFCDKESTITDPASPDSCGIVEDL